MRKIIRLLIFLTLLSSVPTLASDIDTWEKALAERSFASLLANVDRLDAWPRIDSKSKDHNQEHWYAQAKTLLDALDARLHEKHRGATANEINFLLDLRDRVAGSGTPGYVNLLLADALNRVLFVDLSLEVIEGGRVTPDLVSAIERLRSFTVAPEGLLTMAEEERGEPIFEEGKRPEESRELFYALLMAENEGSLERGLFSFMEDLEATGTFRLLETAHVGRLLSRYWTTDYKLNITLPFLVDYVRQAPSFDVSHGYDEIFPVLNLSRESLSRRDTVLHRAPETVSRDVAGLLRFVNRNRLLTFAALDYAPEALEILTESIDS